MKRQFIIRAPEHKDALIRFIDQNWHAMSKTGEPMQVLLSAHRGSRTNDQLAAMWAGILQPMADQIWLDGRRFSAETWHQHAKMTILPDMQEEGLYEWFKARADLSLWLYLPNGDRQFIGSTDMLNKKGMSEYMGRLEAWAVDMDVQLPAAPGSF
jgi:hypothetical protein